MDKAFKKITSKWTVKQILKKLIAPHRIKSAIKLQKRQSNKSKPVDLQLKLYSELLPGDFLHYGYFENPELAAEKISLSDIHQAQLQYAELILEQIKDEKLPVLDAGDAAPVAVQRGARPDQRRRLEAVSGRMGPDHRRSRSGQFAVFRCAGEAAVGGFAVCREPAGGTYPGG